MGQEIGTGADSPRGRDPVRMLRTSEHLGELRQARRVISERLNAGLRQLRTETDLTADERRVRRDELYQAADVLRFRLAGREPGPALAAAAPGAIGALLSADPELSPEQRGRDGELLFVGGSTRAGRERVLPGLQEHALLIGSEDASVDAALGGGGVCYRDSDDTDWLAGFFVEAAHHLDDVGWQVGSSVQEVGEMFR